MHSTIENTNWESNRFPCIAGIDRRIKRQNMNEMIING